VYIARCPGQLTFAVPELTCCVDIKLNAQVLLQLEPSSFTHLPLPWRSGMLKTAIRISLYSLAAIGVGIPLSAIAFIGLALIGF
jgi:hypothetical protein